MKESIFTYLEKKDLLFRKQVCTEFNNNYRG